MGKCDSVSLQVDVGSTLYYIAKYCIVVNKSIYMCWWVCLHIQCSSPPALSALQAAWRELGLGLYSGPLGPGPLAPLCSALLAGWPCCEMWSVSSIRALTGCCWRPKGPIPGRTTQELISEDWPDQGEPDAQWYYCWELGHAPLLLWYHSLV